MEIAQNRARQDVALETVDFITSGDSITFGDLDLGHSIISVISDVVVEDPKVDFLKEQLRSKRNG